VAHVPCQRERALAITNFALSLQAIISNQRIPLISRRDFGSIAHVPPTTAAVAVSPKLLDRVRWHLRVKHYSIRTEQAYVEWIRRFILFHCKRHPNEMGEREITQS
jgi:hypothetical protein